MGSQGTTTLNFGAFPGASDTSVAVTGQAAIIAGSLVEAWIRPVATADHTADEHMLETIKVFAANIVAGTGFTIYGFNSSEMNDRNGLREFRPDRNLSTGTGAGPVGPRGVEGTTVDRGGGKGTRIYGQWTVAWVWN